MRPSLRKRNRCYQREEWVNYTAFGGEYQGRVNGHEDVSIGVPVQQSVVESLGNNQFFVDTGSPHLIILEKPGKSWTEEAYMHRWDENLSLEVVT